MSTPPPTLDLMALLREKRHLPAHIQPIVPNARFMVRCGCGYAHDSAEKSDEAAMAEIRARHPRHGDYELEAARVDYTDHPIYRGAHEHEDAKVKYEWKKEPKA